MCDCSFTSGSRETSASSEFGLPPPASVPSSWTARREPQMAVAHETFQHLTTAGLAEIDPQIAELLGKELERQRGQVELIASENFTWPSVLEAVGSVRRTSTPRAIRARGTTAAARSSTRSSKRR